MVWALVAGVVIVAALAVGSVARGLQEGELCLFPRRFRARAERLHAEARGALERGELERAAALCREAVEEARRGWGPARPEILPPMMELVGVLDRLRRTPERAEVASAVLRVVEGAYDPAEPVTRDALRVAATAQLDWGRYRSALALIDQLLELLDRSPRDPSQQAWALALRSAALRRLCRYDEALDSARRALRLAEPRLHDAKVLRAAALSSIAKCHAALGEEGPAREAFEEARELSMGAEDGGLHVHLRATLGLIRLELDSGLCDEAAGLVDGALAYAGDAIEGTDPIWAELRAAEGRLLLARDMVEPALEPLQESLKLRRHSEGEDHPNVAESLTLLAEASHRLGRDDGAKDLAHRALDIAGPLLPRSHPVIQRARALASGGAAAPTQRAGEGPYR